MDEAGAELRGRHLGQARSRARLLRRVREAHLVLHPSVLHPIDEPDRVQLLERVVERRDRPGCASELGVRGAEHPERVVVEAPEAVEPVLLDPIVLATPARALAAEAPPLLVDGDLVLFRPVGLARDLERCGKATEPTAKNRDSLSFQFPPLRDELTSMVATTPPSGALPGDQTKSTRATVRRLRRYARDSRGTRGREPPGTEDRCRLRCAPNAGRGSSRAGPCRAPSRRSRSGGRAPER